MLNLLQVMLVIHTLEFLDQPLHHHQLLLESLQL
jgi:hypothetical protein